MGITGVRSMIEDLKACIEKGQEKNWDMFLGGSTESLRNRLSLASLAGNVEDGRLDRQEKWNWREECSRSLKQPRL